MQISEGISFPNFLERSILRLPLSKLCAVPFALQNRALFEGEKRVKKGGRGVASKGAKRKKGRTKIGQFQFFQNSLKVLNVYFWGDSIYFWGNKVYFWGNTKNLGFLDFFCCWGGLGLCGSGGPVGVFEKYLIYNSQSLKAPWGKNTLHREVGLDVRSKLA